MRKEDERPRDFAVPPPSWWTMMAMMMPFLAIMGAAIYFTPQR